MRENLNVFSIATYITTLGEIKHIIAINGKTTEGSDAFELTKFIEQRFGGFDDISVAYSPKGVRLFVTPSFIGWLPRDNHGEVKQYEMFISDEIAREIAHNSKIYLTADKVMCVTCRMAKEQYEILNKRGISIDFFEDRTLQTKTDYDEQFPGTWDEDRFKEFYRDWFKQNHIPNYETILNELWEKYKHDDFR